MVATNELRAGDKLKAMDPIWDSLREEARRIGVEPGQGRCWRPSSIPRC